MEKIYKTINNVDYGVLTWGNPFNPNGKDVVICISGNPGLCEFYTDFGSELHKQTSLPVCIINHIGHEEVKDEYLNILTNYKHIYNLEGQLLQKIDFINNHIDKNSRIHLIGHSIGAWMVIELFDKYDELSNRVSSVNLVFPTIQRMAESRNGWFLNNLIRKIYILLIYACIFLQLLPEGFKKFLINIYLTMNSMSEHCDVVMRLLNPHVLEKVLFLAFEEMDTVVKLNVRGIDKIKHISNVIYGQHDYWAPLEYLNDLREFQPELQIQEVNVDHAFIIRSSQVIASMVSDFINKMGQKPVLN